LKPCVLYHVFDCHWCVYSRVNKHG
jgi:hypothetical protein